MQCSRSSLVFLPLIIRKIACFTVKRAFSRINSKCWRWHALSCLVYPPREEWLDMWAANHVCDVNSELKFLRCFWWPQMSSYDNHWRAHMTPTACNINFVHVPFSPTLLLILAFWPVFVSHYCYGRALYAVFYGKVFF